MQKHQFSRNYRESYSKFLQFAQNLTHSRADAKDLVQDAVIKAFRNRGSLRSDTKFRPWFYRVIYNCFISKYKKQKRRKEILEHTGPNKSLFYNKTEVSNQGYSSLKLMDVREVLNSLKLKYRDCFNMYYKGYSYKEIAKTYNIPVGTVKSRINTARKEMQKKIERIAA